MIYMHAAWKATKTATKAVKDIKAANKVARKQL